MAKFWHRLPICCPLRRSPSTRVAAQRSLQNLRHSHAQAVTPVFGVFVPKESTVPYRNTSATSRPNTGLACPKTPASVAVACLAVARGLLRSDACSTLLTSSHEHFRLWLYTSKPRTCRLKDVAILLTQSLGSASGG